MKIATIKSLIGILICLLPITAWPDAASNPDDPSYPIPNSPSSSGAIPNATAIPNAATATPTTGATSNAPPPDNGLLNKMQQMSQQAQQSISSSTYEQFAGSAGGDSANQFEQQDHDFSGTGN